MADSKISALTAATAAATTNEFAINEAGTSKKLTMMQVLAGGRYAPGSFTIPTGGYMLIPKTLILTSTQQAVVEGDGLLRLDD